MSSIKRTEDGEEIILKCDCGIIHNISEDENGKIKLESTFKKESKKNANSEKAGQTKEDTTGTNTTGTDTTGTNTTGTDSNKTRFSLFGK